MTRDTVEVGKDQEITDAAAEKEEDLKRILAQYPSIAVAYSGGVDSTYLADVAHEVLGDEAGAVLADSPSLPRSELKEALALAEARQWRITVIVTDEFTNENYLKNDGRRCYYCKSALFRKMKEYADENGVAVLAYGAMADDSFDPTRLGALAATEYDIVAPLQEAKLGKDDIRQLSRRRGLPTAEKASFACLSSRFPKGTPVTIEALQQIEDAEEALKRHGFYQYRARHHGDICRIEIDMKDIERFLDPSIRHRIVKDITEAGYKHVVLDLAGYKDPNTVAADGLHS